LAYHNNPTSGLLDIKIHHAILIVEDTQARNFSAEPIYILLRVGILYAKQNRQALADLTNYLASNLDTTTLNSLNYDTHRLQGIIVFSEKAPQVIIGWNGSQNLDQLLTHGVHKCERARVERDTSIRI
jgi:hypothetical protein